MDVIIQGTNFSTDISKNIVKFNGIVGDVKTATTTSITATVPNGAKAGNITVTVNGETTTSAHTLSVLGGSWLQRADYGGSARGWAAGFSIGGKGYVVGGFSNTPQRDADVWEYDPATDVWTKKADFPGGGRDGCVGFAIGNKGYVGLGYYPLSPLKDFWEYDPATDTWTKKADFPGPVREWAVGFGFANTGYVGLGYDIAGTINFGEYYDFWKYDPSTDSWTAAKQFPGTAYVNASAVSSIADFLSPMGNSTCAEETVKPASFKYFPACFIDIFSGQKAVSTASNPIPAI